jgi:hypothetical protein
LSQDRALYSYFETIYRCGGWTFDEVKAVGLDEGYPIRNVDLIASHAGRYVINKSPGTARELDELEGAIVELSAGKLSGEEVIELLCERYGEAGSDLLRDAILRRFEALDREWILVWRTNRHAKIRIKKRGGRAQELAYH